MFPKFIQVGKWPLFGRCTYGGFLFGMLTGFHIWRTYMRGGLIFGGGGVLMGFYGITLKDI